MGRFFIDTAQILGYHREYYVLLTRGSGRNFPQAEMLCGSQYFLGRNRL